MIVCRRRLRSSSRVNRWGGSQRTVIGTGPARWGRRRHRGTGRRFHSARRVQCRGTIRTFHSTTCGEFSDHYVPSVPSPRTTRFCGATSFITRVEGRPRSFTVKLLRGLVRKNVQCRSLGTEGRCPSNPLIVRSSTLPWKRTVRFICKSSGSLVR